MGKETPTKDRLLEAGLKTFSRKGYTGATTREIARGAGVAEVTLFRHFSSKEKLFKEVISRYSFLPALKGLLPELKDMEYRDALAVIGRRFLEIMKERRDLVRIVQGEMHGTPGIRRIFYHFTEQMLKTLAVFFKAMQARGMVREIDADLAARAFLGMFFAYFLRQEILKGRTIGKKELDVIVAQFSDIFAEGTLERSGRISPSTRRRVL
jgi:AcrR family transcriptional regulator